MPQGFDYSAVLPGQGHYYNPDFIINGVKERINGYVTTITTELGLDWLKNKRDKSKPFLMLYQQKAPHRNWQSEESIFHSLTIRLLISLKTFSMIMKVVQLLQLKK